MSRLGYRTRSKISLTHQSISDLNKELESTLPAYLLSSMIEKFILFICKILFFEDPDTPEPETPDNREKEEEIWNQFLLEMKNGDFFNADDLEKDDPDFSPAEQYNYNETDNELNQIRIPSTNTN
jgi:hypothetical protein